VELGVEKSPSAVHALCFLNNTSRISQDFDPIVIAVVNIVAVVYNIIIVIITDAVTFFLLSIDTDALQRRSENK
jgi:hypothetical protein